jgi:hypothetical protein
MDCDVVRVCALSCYPTGLTNDYSATAAKDKQHVSSSVGNDVSCIEQSNFRSHKKKNVYGVINIKLELWDI